jgi:hypothetical protein
MESDYTESDYLESDYMESDYSESDYMESDYLAVSADGSRRVGSVVQMLLSGAPVVSFSFCIIDSLTEVCIN